MKLISLECLGYRRTALSGFSYLKLTPESVIQLLLGTNGSGKSSLLREILPSVLRSKDFTEGGFMERIYEHRGTRYTLRSSFNPQRHSFIKDDKEMNEGGTGRVQHELISQEFGISPMVRDLLVGRKPVRFSMMSPLQRRELFTMMSVVNYDYAIQRFGLLRERLRDTAGALKLARNRLVIETSKILDETTRTAMRERADALHTDLGSLLELRTPIDTPSMALEANLRELMRRLDRSSSELHATITRAPKGFTINSESDLLDQIRQHEQQIGVTRDRISQLTERLEELQSQSPAFHLEEGQTKESLETRYAELQAQELALQAQMQRVWAVTHPASALQAIESIRDELVDIFNHIDDNDNDRYSRAKYEQLTTQQHQLAQKKSELERSLTALDVQIEHQDSHRKSGTIECPKCKHAWIQGFIPEKYEQLISNREAIQKEVHGLTFQLSELNVAIEATRHYFDQFRQYLRIKSSTRQLDSLWEACDEDGASHRFPRTIMPLVDVFIRDVTRMVKIQEITVERTTLKDQLDLISRADKAVNAQAEKQLVQLEAQLNQYTDQIIGQTNRLDQLQRFQSSIRKGQSLRDTIFELGKQISDCYQHVINTVRMETLHGTIRELQTELATLEDDLSHVTIQESLIKDLEQQIKNFEVEEQAIKINMQVLSPTEGLIAEGLLGFINTFLAKMNFIIAKIWSYPLVFQECKLSEDSVDLDYRFPIRVKQEIVHDIVDGSEGQAEIVDLAYKIVAMHYLGLEDYPLFLDEFGSTFDPKHRNSSMMSIRQLINQLTFPQVFIVSHYEQSYGSITGSDVTVLCDSNVTLPEGANKCLIRKP